MEKTAKNFAIWMALQSGNFYAFARSMSRFGFCEQTEHERKAQREFELKHEFNSIKSSWNSNCFLDIIHKVGIDWDKSSVPVSSLQNLFVGTFAEDEMVDVVRGELCLIDGSKIPYLAECKVDTNQFETMQRFFNG